LSGKQPTIKLRKVHALNKSGLKLERLTLLLQWLSWWGIQVVMCMAIWVWHAAFNFCIFYKVAAAVAFSCSKLKK